MYVFIYLPHIKKYKENIKKKKIQRRWKDAFVVLLYIHVCYCFVIMMMNAMEIK